MDNTTDLQSQTAISTRVGTLAIASSFSLLARASTGLQHAPPGQRRLVMVLIGESDGIRAGHLTPTL